MNSSIKAIIQFLNLKPHPEEGGFFSETYRSHEMIPSGALPVRYQGDRSIGTCIYYLLTESSFSAMHRLKSDEIFHFYLGDPVEMLQLHPDCHGEIVTIGNDLFGGMYPQVIVKQNIWQGSRLAPGGKFALLGTTVAPGFEFIDYEHGKREELIRLYPKFEKLIISLTR